MKTEKLRQIAGMIPYEEDKDSVAFTQDEHFTPAAPDPFTETHEDTLMQAAAKKTWLGYSLKNQYEVAQGDIDEDYQVTPEQLQSYKDKGYSDRELELLGAAHSADNFDVRLHRIDDDREIDRQLNEAGGWGVAAQLGTGFADPALLPTMLLTGGGAAMSKLNTAKAVAVSAVEGTAVNGAMEYFMAQGDTQRDTTDVVLAMASGAALSGLITAGSRGYKAHMDNRIDAVEIDADNGHAIDGVIADREYKKANEAISQVMTDGVQRKRYMTDREALDTLHSEVLAKETGERLSAKKLKKLKKEFNDYKASKMELIGKISGSKMRPTAKRARIEQLQAAIDKRKAKLDKVWMDSKEASKVRGHLDALQQGKVPDELMEQFKAIKGELGEPELPMTVSVDAEKVAKAEQDKAVDSMPEVEAPKVEGKAKSVGAAATDPLTLKYEMYGNLLPELDEGSVTKVIDDAQSFGQQTPRVSKLATGAPITRSLSSEVDSSVMDVIRGLGAKLFPNGVRSIKGHQSAVEVANGAFHRSMIHVNEFNQAKENWMQKQGISWWDFAKQSQAQREYDRLTTLAQVVGSEDEHILAGAKSKAELNKLALDTNKSYGVHGFEQVSHREDYVPIVYDYDNMTDLIKSGARPEEIVDTIAKAYQTGGIPIEEQYAITLAKAQVERAASTTSGVNKAYRFGVTETDFKHVEKALLDSGLDAKSVHELRESIFTDELKQNRSPRAMHSLRPNIQATSGNVRMIDVLDTSVNRNMKYMHESSANAGLYSVGIQGRKQLQQVLDEVEKTSQNEILARMKDASPKEYKVLEKELEMIKNGHYRERIEGGVSLMFGEPISKTTDVAGDAMKGLRKSTSMLRLRATGLTTIPEYAYAMARTGGLRTLKAAMGSRFFDLRKGSILKDEFMQDFSSAFGATGHQEYIFGRNAYQGSDFDDVTKTKLGKVMDRFLDKGMNMTMTANLFRSIQHGGEETVARGIVAGLKEAGKTGTMNRAVKSLVDVGGLSEEEAMRFAKQLGKSKDIFDGVKMLDPQDQIKLAAAVQSHISSSFMRVRVGEGSYMSHQEMGKVLTHLLNFAIASYEKQLVRGLKHEKAMLTAVMGAQFAMGTMAQVAYVYQKAAAMDGAKRREYMRTNLDSEHLFWGAINKVGVLAYPMTMMQGLSSLGLLPSAITGSPTKAGVSSFGGVPVVGMARDFAKASKAGVHMLTDNDSMEDEEAARDIKRVMPIVDTPLWNLTAGQILADN